MSDSRKVYYIQKDILGDAEIINKFRKGLNQQPSGCVHEAIEEALLIS